MAQTFGDAFIASPDQIDPTLILPTSLQSANYVPGVSGYRLDYATGDVEFGSGVFRGELESGEVALGPLAGMPQFEVTSGSISIREAGGITIDSASDAAFIHFRHVTAGPNFLSRGGIQSDATRLSIGGISDLRLHNFGTGAVRIAGGVALADAPDGIWTSGLASLYMTTSLVGAAYDLTKLPAIVTGTIVGTTSAGGDLTINFPATLSGVSSVLAINGDSNFNGGVTFSVHGYAGGAFIARGWIDILTPAASYLVRVNWIALGYR